MTLCLPVKTSMREKAFIPWTLQPKNFRVRMPLSIKNEKKSSNCGQNQFSLLYQLSHRDQANKEGDI